MDLFAVSRSTKKVAIYPTDLLVQSGTRTRQSNPNCYKHIRTEKDVYKDVGKCFLIYKYTYIFPLRFSALSTSVIVSWDQLLSNGVMEKIVTNYLKS